MTWVAGVDGCKAGWIVALRNIRTGRWHLRLCCSFHDVLSLDEKPEIIGLDLPIGLLDSHVPGGRDCDRQARRLLGRPRRNSVFSPPSRASLHADAAPSSGLPEGLTRQAAALLPKLREVDAAMTPGRQEWVKEVHPELCFYTANGDRPMVCRKKRRGRDERQAVLERLYGRGWAEWWDHVSRVYPRKSVALDDLLDAHIAAWTAERIHRGSALRLPADPPVDTRDLRMEIWR